MQVGKAMYGYQTGPDLGVPKCVGEIRQGVAVEGRGPMAGRPRQESASRMASRQSPVPAGVLTSDFDVAHEVICVG